MAFAPVGFDRATGRFGSVSGFDVPTGMIRGPRTAYTASGTKTIATETPWIPPAGYVLDGFEVIAIGAGGGSASGQFGLGGWRKADYVPLASMGGATTVVITVGAGASYTTGGYSAFGNFVHAPGGEVGGSRWSPWDGPLIIYSSGSNGADALGIQEATGAGNDCPSGFRAGAGGADYGAESRSGGACYPHPNARGAMRAAGGFTGRGGHNSFTTSSLSNVALAYHRAGNPTTTAGAAGHDGIGDWPGGGGNYASSGSGGVGGFPGGGAGAGNLNQRGGHGVVIVYPWFKKAF